MAVIFPSTCQNSNSHSPIRSITTPMLYAICNLYKLHLIVISTECCLIVFNISSSSSSSSSSSQNTLLSPFPARCWPEAFQAAFIHNIQRKGEGRRDRMDEKQKYHYISTTTTAYHHQSPPLVQSKRRGEKISYRIEKSMEEEHQKLLHRNRRSVLTRSRALYRCRHQ